MRLPVIQTCGECSWSKHRSGHYSGSPAKGCQHPEAGALPISHRSEPPHACPLRTGPDAERIAALEAVASAADAYRQKRTGAGPLDAAIRHLRKLT